MGDSTRGKAIVQARKVSTAGISMIQMVRKGKSEEAVRI